MKKFITAALLLILSLMCVLAACKGNNTEASSADAEASRQITDDAESNEAESNEASSDKSDVSAPQESEASGGNSGNGGSSGSGNQASDNSESGLTEQEGDVEIFYASYSEKPYAAVVGKCAEGATVVAEGKNGRTEAKSWHGWFSVRINCDTAGDMFVFTQEIEGESVGEPTVKAIYPVTPSSDMWPIITGLDSQLFFKKMLPDFQHANLPSDYDLSTFRSRVSGRISQLREINPDAEIIYMVVPSSMTVYPELVPDNYKKGTGKSRLDLFTENAKSAGAKVIDLRAAFENHKYDEKPLYYKFDSHWTDYGAFVAYTELFGYISEKFPAASPRAESEFSWNGSDYESGDMIYYLQMSREVVKDYGYLRQMNFSDASGASRISRYVSNRRLTYSNEVTWEQYFSTGDSKKPNLLVLRDSYSTQIYDILPERACNTHYLGMWNYTWDYSIISAEAPDYVIYIIAEWNLDSVLYS